MWTKLFQSFSLDITGQITNKDCLGKIFSLSLRVLLNFLIFYFFLLLLISLNFGLVFLIDLLLLLLMIRLLSFLHLFCHESNLCDRKVNNNRSSLINSLIQFFDSFLAGSILGKFNKGKTFVALLVVRIQRNLNFLYLSIGSKQFS